MVHGEYWGIQCKCYDAAQRIDKPEVDGFLVTSGRMFSDDAGKSQGQTYQSVAVDMSDGAFEHGQTYVALSRCPELSGFYLTTPIRREDIIVDPETAEFMKKAEVL